jgi:hypothetical protein
MTRNRVAIAAAIVLLTCSAGAGLATARAETTLQATETVTHYRTATVDEISLFYREAGPSNGPSWFCCTAFQHRRTCSAT